MELNFKITNQKLEKLDKNFIVQKSNNYLQLNFEFLTSDWDNLTKFVILRNDKRKSYLFNYSSDGVIVPSAVVDGRGFYVTVYGADETTKRITTNEIGILLAKTGYTKDISSIDDEGMDAITEIKQKLDTKFDTVALDGGVIVFSNDQGEILGTVDLSEYPFVPGPHTHTVSDITDMSTVLDDKADKTGGVAQVTDPNSNNYTNIGSLSSGATQQAINDAVNTKIGVIEGLKFIIITNDKGTASADTMGKLYIVSENSKVNIYYTKQTGTGAGATYSWEKMDADILDELVVNWNDIQGKPSFIAQSDIDNSIGDFATALAARINP